MNPLKTILHPLKRSIVFLIALAQSVIAAATTYYISPTGDDSRTAVQAQNIATPWRTLTKGCSVLVAGDILYVRGGTYPTPSPQTMNRSGNSGAYILISRYQNEVPVFDYSGTTHTSGITGFQLNGCQFVHVYGIRITGIPQVNSSYHYGIVLGDNCSNNIIEFCEVDHIGGSGINMAANCNNNLVLNCDAHHLMDPMSTTPYGGSNGFDITNQTTSSNNTFRFCRAWWISDDGYDCFNTKNPVIYDGCWSFWNGYIPGTFTPAGNGDGFKGGPTPSGSTTVLRTFTNCLAFENRLDGFDENFNSNGYFPCILYNNTAYKNVDRGFQFGAPSTAINILKNNLAYFNSPTPTSGGTQANVNTQSTQSNNSWNGLSGVVLNDAQFLSVSSVGMDGPRQTNGDLPVVTFMHLAPTSTLIDKGVNVGLPFNGNAPDLGCFETGNGTPPPTLQAFATATTSILCNGQSVTVSVTGAGGNPPYNNTGNFTRAAGTWTFTITDQSGTTATANVTITQPPAISVTQSSTPITINGNPSTTTVTATGGSPTLQYKLDNGAFQTSPVFAGVLAGAHVITVKDANNCTATLNYTLTQPSVLVAASSQTGTVLCFNATVTINVTATGGTLPYTGTGPFVRTAGSYSFTVTDGAGAKSTTNITVTGPTQITISQTSTAILVNGGTSTTTFTATGGTGAKTYSINNGASFQSSPVFAGLPAGNYTVIVKDANNCTNSFSYTITQPSALLAASSQTSSILCNGATGSILVTASGGTPPYTNTGTFPRGAGTSSFTVTDAAGATSVTTITITQPAAILVSQTSTAILINGATSTSTFTASGGTGALLFSLDGSAFQSGTSFTGVLAGNHTVTVKDANNCTKTLSYNISQPSALVAASAAVGSILCNGNTITINVTASGGTPPYTGTGPFVDPAGTYTFTVRDANGAISTTSITVTQPAAIVIGVSFGPAPATVTTSVTGGVPTLNYKLDAGAFQPGNTFTGVTAGTHVITVRDGNACTNTKTFTVGASLSIAATVTPILCNGGSAQVTITAMGGLSPYTGPGIYSQTVGTTKYTVRDNTGATHDTTITVTQPSLINVSATFTAILTSGGTSTVTAASSGGVGSKMYSLDGSAYQSGTSFPGILAGNHTLTARDANNCTAIFSFTITQPGVFHISVTVPGSIACYNGTTPVVVTASGGIPPYTGTGSFPTVAGTTTFTVHDAQGAVYDTIITISQPTQVIPTATFTAILTNGATSTVTAASTGGTGSKTYSLDGSAYQGGTSFTGVLAGTHVLSAKDASNCINTYTFTITQPGALLTTATPSGSISCYGDSVDILVTITGGTPPYIGAGTFRRPAGTYTFHGSDIFGAVDDTIITISQPPAIVIAVAFTPILINGNTSTVTTTATGGTGTLTYSMTGVSYQGSNVFAGVSAGNYTLYVKDGNGCVGTHPFSITQPGVIHTIATPSGPILCAGGTVNVVVTVTGGTGPFSGTGTFVRGAGTWPFSVTDQFGAVDDTILTLTEPVRLTADSVIRGTIAAYGGFTYAKVYVAPGSGTGAYQYKLDGGSYQMSDSLTPVTGGAHTVTIKDANNCTGTYSFTVTQPPPPLSDFYLKRRRVRHYYYEVH